MKANTKGKVYLINYTLPNIFRIKALRFIPGLNRITEDEWNSIKDHPLLPYRFENGDLAWVKGRGPDDFGANDLSSSDEDNEGKKDNEDFGNALSGFNGKEAIELVKNTFDLDILNQWKATEAGADKPRKGVIGAIEDQIEKILKLDEK